MKDCTFFKISNFCVSIAIIMAIAFVIFSEKKLATKVLELILMQNTRMIISI